MNKLLAIIFAIFFCSLAAPVLCNSEDLEIELLTKDLVNFWEKKAQNAESQQNTQQKPVTSKLPVQEPAKNQNQAIKTEISGSQKPSKPQGKGFEAWWKKYAVQTQEFALRVKDDEESFDENELFGAQLEKFGETASEFAQRVKDDEESFDENELFGAQLEKFGETASEFALRVKDDEESFDENELFGAQLEKFGETASEFALRVKDDEESFDENELFGAQLEKFGETASEFALRVKENEESFDENELFGAQLEKFGETPSEFALRVKDDDDDDDDNELFGAQLEKFGETASEFALRVKDDEDSIDENELFGAQLEKFGETASEFALRVKDDEESELSRINFDEIQKEVKSIKDSDITSIIRDIKKILQNTAEKTGKEAVSDKQAQEAKERLQVALNDAKNTVERIINQDGAQKTGEIRKRIEDTIRKIKI